MSLKKRDLFKPRFLDCISYLQVYVSKDRFQGMELFLFRDAQAFTLCFNSLTIIKMSVV